MKTAALICVLLVLGGCVPDALNASSTGPMGSTSSRRASKDPDEARQMCQDTSVGGESKTVCY